MFWRVRNPVSLWDEMERLRGEFDRVVSNYQRQRVAFPALNLWTDENEAAVTAELPGVKGEDLDIAVEGGVLTLRGKREVGEAEATYHRRERAGGSFVRTLELPFAVDADKVEASLERGVLRVHLPRAETDKPRKITVKSQ